MNNSPTKEWLVVVNPNAGTGRGKKDWKEISRLLNKFKFDFQTFFTERKLHAIEKIPGFITQGFRKIIVVGGDGTMNEVVNGIFSQNKVQPTDITLGMVSVGTGNDWGRTYNIPRNYHHAIEVIKQERTFNQDAGYVTYSNGGGNGFRFFANMAGLGFDGLVAQKTNAAKEKGKSNPLIYIGTLISSLFFYKSTNIRVIINGTEIKDKVFSIAIGIGKYNGGGMKQAPEALPDDGLFDLTIIKHMKKTSMLANLKNLYSGKIKKVKQVQLLKGNKVRIESDIPILLETDGESLGYSPFEFNILPKSLKIIRNYIDH
ncbi:MAG TPA: diacylglycerol kinase family protein [Bacteroidales bacterium]|nr:diacylglycerol kinase family protein [Bacteroidales bacterium]